MSKQTAEPRSAAGAEEKSSTGVLDAPEVDRQTLKQDHETAKQSQKGRLAGLDSETLIGLYRQMLLIRRFGTGSVSMIRNGREGSLR